MSLWRSKKILAMLNLPHGKPKATNEEPLNKTKQLSTPEGMEICESNNNNDIFPVHHDVHFNYTVDDNVEIQVVDLYSEKSSPVADIFKGNEVSTPQLIGDCNYSPTNDKEFPTYHTDEEVVASENPFSPISSQNNSLPNIVDNIEDLISDESVQGLVPYGFNSDSENSDVLPTKSKKRRKRVLVKKETWFAERNKQLRQQGLTYYGRQKNENGWDYEKIKEPRVMKPKCKCKQRGENGTMKCILVTEEERREIFKEFWSMDWGQKKVYVNSCVRKVPVKRTRGRKVQTESRRGQTFQYFLKVRNEEMKVCRTLFLNTLSLGRRCISNWLNKPIGAKKQSPQGTQRNISGKSKITKEREALISFLDALPTMDSHYCRATTEKRYLLPEWPSKRKLYDFYVRDWCAQSDVRPLSIAKFNEMYDIKDLSLFAPKKDQCEKCASYSVGQLSEEEYILHQSKKDEARTEKARDKEAENIVFTVDLQAVLMAPKSHVSSLYYRTKLQVHNLTFYNLINREGYCYLWNEVEGGVNAEEFSSIWTNMIEEKVLPNIKIENPRKIIFYTDGCTYQNRNCVMSNALLNSAIKHKLTIEQKFLETGHTQMEADSMHSTIERALKNKIINVPADYIGICRAARKNPCPYDVTYLTHDFFKKYADVQFYKSIRPGRGKGDARVTDIRALRYTQHGELFFKLRFCDSWQKISQRRDSNVVALQWNQLKQLHQKRRNITARKFEDLQHLKTCLPKDYHKYYDDLPHD